MSQKINPISNKLGILQIWNYNFQNYGKKLKNYTKFTQTLNFIFDYINRVFNKSDLLLEDIYIVQTFQKSIIKLFIFDENKSQLKLKNHNWTKLISHWLNCPVILNFYKINNLGNSTFLLSNYINYLFLQKTNPPKKILQIVYKILQEQTVKTKIIYTINGIQIFKLKGFKIEISGCFDSSRSQMAKTLKCNFGSVPLTKLKGYVDYSSNVIFTKFGSCGFKIWFFYELN